MLLEMKISFTKLKERLRQKIVLNYDGTSRYWMYSSVWKSKIFARVNVSSCENMYFAAMPNPGAGIGHQIANWIAGLWFAEQFGLKFAHIPFSDVKWEEFLGFY